MRCRVDGVDVTVIGISRYDRDFHIAGEMEPLNEIMDAMKDGDIHTVELESHEGIVKRYELIWRSMQYDLDDAHSAAQLSFFCIREVKGG